jgi:hypothetical protein
MQHQEPTNNKSEQETKKAVSRRDAIKRMAGAAATILPIAAAGMSCAPYCSYYYSYAYYYYNTYEYYSEYCSMG